MEKHFLDDFVHEMEKESGEGTPEARLEPWYNKYGDCIVYQTVGEAVVADRVGELLTIYRSAIDERPIGFQIKGVMAMIQKFGLDGLQSISVGALLLAAYEDGPMTLGRRQAYASVVRPPAEHDAVAVAVG